MHASCLGHNELPDCKLERLTTRDRNRQVGSFAAKARSALYASERDARPLHTADAFRAAAAERPAATHYWLGRSAASDPDRATEIVAGVPDAMMPEVAKRFAAAIMRANQTRLLQTVG